MSETHTGVAFSPDNIVRRQCCSCHGMAAELVELMRLDPFEYRLRAPCHLLIASRRTA